MSVANGSALERIATVGLQGANPVDLLAIVLARSEDDVEACERDAIRLTKRFGVEKLLDIGPAELKEASGLEPFESVQRLAAMELGRRAALAGRNGAKKMLLDCESVYELFKDLESQKQEHFCAAYLDSKGALLRRSTIHIGTVNASMVGAREVFREAVRENAASLIVAHNHPSGDPTPSPEDLAVTRKLASVGEMLDIPLLDHLIIGRGKFHSFQREGVL